MSSNPGFVCKAPWTSIAFQPTGVGPCCTYDLDHVEKFTTPQNLFTQIRQDFLSGTVPDGCIKCKQSHEEFGNGYYQWFDTYQTDFKTVAIQEINLRSNNFCNLACRSCGPHFSSKWEQEFAGQIKITKDHDVASKVLSLNLRDLKNVVFAGGEPTIVPEHLMLLSQLRDIGHTDLGIRISTNLHSLTYNSIDLVDLWSNFPNLYLQVSIDGIKDRAADIRSGSKWHVIEKNLHRITEAKINYYVNITVSALNIWFLEETLDYFSNNFTCAVKFNLLRNPDIVNMRVIPPKFRPYIETMFESCSRKGYDIQSIRDYFQFEDQSDLWPAFLIYNLMLDVSRGENFCRSLPIFDQLTNDWVRL